MQIVVSFDWRAIEQTPETPLSQASFSTVISRRNPTAVADPSLRAIHGSAAALAPVSPRPALAARAAKMLDDTAGVANAPRGRRPDDRIAEQGQPRLEVAAERRAGHCLS
jgi:hypothetical protein